jgi:hypothetical protein
MTIRTLRSSHPQAGTTVTRVVTIGRLHLSLEFCRGVYGFRHTPSCGFRVWVS